MTHVGKENVKLFLGSCDKVFGVDLSFFMVQLILFQVHEEAEKHNVMICILWIFI